MLRLGTRFGRLETRAPLLFAAVLAAHGANERGFRLAEVQFFFFLFGNWTSRDALRAGDRLELTQVRRILLRLVKEGAATAKGRPPRYRLTRAGVDSLAQTLASVADDATFEESIFVATFFRLYGDALTTRRPIDPLAIAVRGRRRVERVLADLEERVRTSREVAEVAEVARARGASPRQIADAVEDAGAYQLQHVRAFATFAYGLPEPLRSFELGDAFRLRSELLFETFAARARAELAAWDAFMAALRVPLRAAQRAR